MPLNWVPGYLIYGGSFFVEVFRNNDVGPIADWGVVERPLRKKYY